MFNDRIEIYSSGEMVSGTSLEEQVEADETKMPVYVAIV